jgi:glycogen phosphorylase
VIVSGNPHWMQRYHLFKAGSDEAAEPSRTTMSETLLPLPAELDGLRELAYNLRWSWHGPSRELFTRVDPALWHATGENPVRLLRQVSTERLRELTRDERFTAELAAGLADLRAYLSETTTWWDRTQAPGSPGLSVAYFSAEFAVANCLPIFAGGLGVLAGDHLKSASDLGVPLVAVGLLYREGYFRQSLDSEGRQVASYQQIDPLSLPVSPARARDGWPIVIRVPLLDRQVCARVWRVDVGRVPLFLLDTDIAANRAEDRMITNRLYGGDIEHRLRQEIVLGIGGVRALNRSASRATSCT